MQDRPTVPELLQAVVYLLDEELVPNLTGSRQFYGRVAANVLRTVIRELEHEEEQLAAEWKRLDEILPSSTEYPPTRAGLREAILRRTEDLCERIRQGDADAGPYRDQVLAHVRQSVREKLLVSDPNWLSRPDKQ